MRWIAGAVIFTLMLGPAGVSASSNGQAGEIDAASAYYTGASGAPAVENQNPRPGSRLRTYFPQFFAAIATHGGAPLRKESLRLSVDGTDVTAAASISANAVSYIPRARMPAGWHDVFLQGADTLGRAFSDAWTFQSEAPDGVNITNPGNGLQIVRSGDPGSSSGFTHMFFTSPDDGSALLQLCGFPALAFVHVRLSPVFFITVPVQFAGGFLPFGGCAPQVLFSPFGAFGSIFIPLQIGGAGPGFFHHHHHHRPRSTMPVIRAPEPSLPVIGGAVPGSMRTAPVMTMPRATMPQVRMPVVSVPHVIVPRVTVPRVTLPHVSVPHASVPITHPR